MQENNETKPGSDSNIGALKAKSGSTKNILIAAVVILAIGIISLGAYGYTKIQSDNKKINSLNSQISDLQNTKKNLETAAVEAAKAAATQVVSKVMTTTSDVDQVNTLAKNQVEAEVGAVVGKNVTLSSATICTDKQFATAKRNSESMAFKKVNGTWVYIFGYQNITPELTEKWGLPSSFCTGQ